MLPRPQYFRTQPIYNENNQLELIKPTKFKIS